MSVLQKSSRRSNASASVTTRGFPESVRQSGDATLAGQTTELGQLERGGSSKAYTLPNTRPARSDGYAARERDARRARRSSVDSQGYSSVPLELDVLEDSTRAQHGHDMRATPTCGHGRAYSLPRTSVSGEHAELESQDTLGDLAVRGGEDDRAQLIERNMRSTRLRRGGSRRDQASAPNSNESSDADDDYTTLEEQSVAEIAHAERRRL